MTLILRLLADVGPQADNIASQVPAPPRPVPSYADTGVRLQLVAARDVVETRLPFPSALGRTPPCEVSKPLARQTVGRPCLGVDRRLRRL